MIKQLINGTVLRLAGLVIAMFGFGFLMVPLYNVICDITGLNGKTGVIGASAAARYQVDESRKIRVEFLGAAKNGGWQFAPEVSELYVHPGQPTSTAYFATNLGDSPAVASAVPSVAPREASLYFNKTECFCFTEQRFAKQERKRMPVTFVIDPDLPPSVDTISLSYSFIAKG